MREHLLKYESLLSISHTQKVFKLTDKNKKQYVNKNE